MPDIFRAQNRTQNWTWDLPSRISIGIKMPRQKHEAKMVMLSVGIKKNSLMGKISGGSVRLSHFALEMICMDFL